MFTSQRYALLCESTLCAEAYDFIIENHISFSELVFAFERKDPLLDTPSRRAKAQILALAEYIRDGIRNGDFEEVDDSLLSEQSVDTHGHKNWLTDSLSCKGFNKLILARQDFIQYRNVLYNKPKIDKIKNEIAAYIKSKKAPVSSKEIIEFVQKEHNDVDEKSIRNWLTDRKKFKAVGRKSLYLLSGTSKCTKSVSQTVDSILERSKNPLEINQLVEKTLKLRPDSNARSIRAVVLSKLRSKELRLFDNDLVGLPNNQKKYPKKYVEKKYVGLGRIEEQDVDSSNYIIGEVHISPNNLGKNINNLSRDELLGYAEDFIGNGKYIFAGYKDYSGNWRRIEKKLYLGLANELSKFQSKNKDFLYYQIKWLLDTLCVQKRVLEKYSPGYEACTIKVPLPKFCKERLEEGKIETIVIKDRGASTWKYFTKIFQSEEDLEEIGQDFSKVVLNENNPERIDMHSCACLIMHYVLWKDSKWKSCGAFIKYIVNTFVDSNSVLKYDDYGRSSGIIKADQNEYPFMIKTIEADNNSQKVYQIYLLSKSADIPTYRIMDYLGNSDYRSIFELEEISYNILGLTRNGLGKVSVGKIVLMLSVFELINDGSIDINRIYPTEQLQATFAENWNNYIGNNKKYIANFYDSFYHLKNEYYWDLININGKVDLENFSKNSMTKEDFERKYLYAKIPKAYFYIFSFSWLHDVIKNVFIQQLKVTNQ